MASSQIRIDALESAFGAFVIGAEGSYPRGEETSIARIVASEAPL